MIDVEKFAKKTGIKVIISAHCPPDIFYLVSGNVAREYMEQYAKELLRGSVEAYESFPLPGPIDLPTTKV